MDRNIMNEKILDCRGLACPGPVLNTKNYIEEKNAAEFTVIVDNAAAKENVLRFLERSYYLAEVKEENGDFTIKAFKKSGNGYCEIMEQAEHAEKNSMILIGAEYFGKGDDYLGRKLMINFIETLKEAEGELYVIVFLNAGVKLTAEGSPVLDTLKYLEKKDIKILVCGTCLTHFNLLEKKQVGETTNMLDIVSAMRLVDKVIDIT